MIHSLSCHYEYINISSEYLFATLKTLVFVEIPFADVFLFLKIHNCV